MNSLPNLDPWIGRLMGDNQRYRLEKRIGAGGMGDVFLATDTRLGQKVALKLLKDTLAAAEEPRKRFKREIDICAALASTHIVQIRDSGVTSEGYPFYVMEFLQGESLGQLWRREQQLPIDRTVKIIRQVCAGLQLAHQGVTLWRDGATTSEHIKVVPRDLKPDNIFLIPTDLGELVKILDFGIAKIRDDTAEFTSLTGAFIGTFRYAAPEQLQAAQNIDSRADIYSLGIILYEMLTGVDPFGFGVKARRTSGLTWGMAHVAMPPQPMRTQPGCEQLPVQLEAIVMRCLQKAPEDRFTSVEELSQALQSWTMVNRSHAVAESVDATIAQVPVAPIQKTVEPTVARLIAPDTLVPSDITNVQTPLPQRQKISNNIIAQTSSSLQSETRAVTTTQYTCADRQKNSDAMMAQVSPPSQLDKVNQYVVAQEQNLPPRQQKAHQRQPTSLLLMFIVGFAVGFAAIAATFFAYWYFQQSKTENLNAPPQPTTPESSTPAPW